MYSIMFLILFKISEGKDFSEYNEYMIKIFKEKKSLLETYE